MLLHGPFQIDRLVSKTCFLNVELPGELEKYCVVNRCLSPHAFELVPGHVQQSLRQLSDAAFFIKERREVTGFKIVLQRTDSPLEQQSGIFRSEEHTSELQSLTNLVCRLLLEKKKKQI